MWRKAVLFMALFDFITDEKLRSQLVFMVECDKVKNIFRRTLITDGSRRENDAEHSWHLALCAMIFEEYAADEINMLKVLKMVTVHDLIEIYAGDTFAYDTEGLASKAQREHEAADKLFGLLDAEQCEEFRSLWLEFESRETPDALYAAAMDTIKPLIHNYMTDGATWKGGVTSDKVYERNAPVKAAAPGLWQVVEGIIEGSVKKGILKR